MILILALFLIVMVPMVTGYIDQTTQQAAVQLQIDQVQLQIDEVKAKISSLTSVTAEAAKLKADVETARLQYKNIGDNPEVSKVLMDLAWDYDITITGMIVSQAVNKVLGTDYPVLSYSMNLTGQVANFQNFLIAAGRKLPTTQFTSVIIKPATVEGELDTATMNLQVYCNN